MAGEKALGLGTLPKLCKMASSLSSLGSNKAMEAASSAYYNPANPHNVYMPMVSGLCVPAPSSVTKRGSGLLS